MNKYLACLSFVALCFCLGEAAPGNNVQSQIHQASQEVRAQWGVAIKSATREALSRATTPQERACATSRVGPANSHLNAAINRELSAIEIEAAQQQLDVTALRQRFENAAASATQGWLDQIQNCA